MEKKILIFMPSIEGGGVEKNLFLVSNFLIKKFKKVSLITISKNYKKKFNKSIEFISLSSNTWDSFGRKIKYVLVGLDFEVPLFAKHKACLENKTDCKVIVSSAEVVGICNDKWLTYCFLRDS